MKASERRGLRFLAERNLRTKYQNLFLNEFRFEGLDYGVADFFMRKLLFLGRVAAFNIDSVLEEGRTLAFGTFTSHQRDWKGDPINVKILNEYNNPLIPKKDLTNNKEVVILDLGFVPNSYISEYVARILDIQATIETNLILNKMPFVIKSTDKKTVQAIQELLRNEAFIWTDDMQFNTIETKIPYIIDKLTLFKSETEAELLSVLGIDNVKFEKKAQMTVDEVNSNEDEIDAYRKVIRDRMELFFEQVKNVLGHEVKIEKDQDEIYKEE